MKYRLKDMEHVAEKVGDIPLTVVELEDGTELVLEGWWVYIESLDISLRQGVICPMDEETGMVSPDFDVTVVYEGQVRENTELYYEQDDFVTTLNNWLKGDKPDSELRELWCEVIIDSHQER